MGSSALEVHAVLVRRIAEAAKFDQILAKRSLTAKRFEAQLFLPVYEFHMDQGFCRGPIVRSWRTAASRSTGTTETNTSSVNLCSDSAVR